MLIINTLTRLYMLVYNVYVPIITLKTWKETNFFARCGTETCLGLFSGNLEQKKQNITYNSTYGRYALDPSISQVDFLSQ